MINGYSFSKIAVFEAKVLKQKAIFLRKRSVPNQWTTYILHKEKTGENPPAPHYGSFGPMIYTCFPRLRPKETASA